MVRNMDKGARVWSLLTTRGWARRIVGGVLVLVLVVAATVWWLWPEGIPETTDAPPPSPLAESPPALPTEQLWSATSGTVAVAPGGYAVLVRQSVTVRDLFTGEIRWEYQHSEQSAIGISMLGADRMVIRFAVPDHKDARERAFHIPSGQRLDITETRQIIQATKPDSKPPMLADSCGPELDHAFIANQGTWLVLLDCGEHTDVVSVAATTGQVGWQTELPVTATDFPEIFVADVGYGMAVVYADEWVRGNNDGQLFGVDLVTGVVRAHVPVGEHIRWPLHREDIVAVPEGFCVWEFGLTHRIACYDLATGQQRWYRYDKPISSREPPTTLVLPGEILLLIADDHPPRWVGYRLSDGEPQFDLDIWVPGDPKVAHYGDGVLVLTGSNGRAGSAIVVYGDA